MIRSMLRYLILPILYGLCVMVDAGDKPAQNDKAPNQKLSVIDIRRASDAERTLAATLQGLVNKTEARVWIEGGGMQKILLNELKTEGYELEQVATVWELVASFRAKIKGCIVYDSGNRSINAATALCGPFEGVAIHKSILKRAKKEGLKVLHDVSDHDDPVETYETFKDRFAKGILAEQAPKKVWHLRDFIVQRNAFVFWDVSANLRTRFARECAAEELIYGWGKDERNWVRDISKGGAAGIPADWSTNLSALSHLKVEVPAPPKAKPLTKVKEGERIVAFVMSDGDNLQWLGNSFATSTKHWGSRHRGTFTMSWEMAPVLSEVAPRIQRQIYRSASRGQYVDELIVGPSGVGYAFHNHLPNRKAFAKKTAQAMKVSNLSVVTLLNSGGNMTQARELLEHPNVLGAVYKDYAPYHKRRGALDWHNGKPCLSYRYLLWEGMKGASPKEVAAAIKKLPASPATDPNSYALVNVHAWSWDSIGGPMNAIKQTIDLLPSGTRFVTASQLLGLLGRHHSEDGRKRK